MGCELFSSSFFQNKNCPLLGYKNIIILFSVCGICPLYITCVGFLVALSELVTEAGWQKHCKARPLLLVADSDQVCPDALGTCCQLRTVPAVRGLCRAPHCRQKLQERRKVCPRQHVLQLWSKRKQSSRHQDISTVVSEDVHKQRQDSFSRLACFLAAAAVVLGFWVQQQEAPRTAAWSRSPLEMVAPGTAGVVPRASAGRRQQERQRAGQSCACPGRRDASTRRACPGAGGPCTARRRARWRRSRGCCG